MPDRPEVLIVSYDQLGALTDVLAWCRELRHRWDVRVVDLDRGLPEVSFAGVERIPVTHRPLGSADLGLARAAVAEIRRRRPSVVLLMNTKLCFLVRLVCPGVPMVFDVRSASVNVDAGRRRAEDCWIRCNAGFFRHRTVVSRGVATRLRLDPRRTQVVPVGADLRSVPRDRGPDQLRLLYVGTFSGRGIDETVAGLGAFVRDGAHGLRCSYTLVGFGSPAEEHAIRSEVERWGLDSVVRLAGRLPHHRLDRLFDTHDVGVVYTPVVPWYEDQPATKMYEYLLAGMPVLATGTRANRQSADQRAAIFIEDTPDGFRHGLQEVAARLGSFEEAEIREAAVDHTWERIVTRDLEPVLLEAAGLERREGEG